MMAKNGNRVEDRSGWAAISLAMEKYKLLITIGTWLAIAAGFGFRTPAQTTNELRVEIKTNRVTVQAEVDTLRAQLAAGAALANTFTAEDLVQIREDLRTLLLLRCIDKSLSARERTLARLTPERCNKL